jgi:hypothetical protein
MVGDYLNESHEDDLVRSIFEEVSEETWDAIQEAILSELSPAVLNRYVNKSIRNQDKYDRIGRDADDRIANMPWQSQLGDKRKASDTKVAQQMSDRAAKKSMNRAFGQQRAYDSLDKKGK